MCGVITQGRNIDPVECVTKYQVMYGDDGTDWTNAHGDGGVLEVSYVASGFVTKNKVYKTHFKYGFQGIYRHHIVRG
jgi:hypothetical protein